MQGITMHRSALLLQALMGLAGLAFLAGCATPPQPVDDGIDHAKVQLIERAAQRFGTQVIWINPPKRGS